MMPRFLTRLIVSASASLLSWRDVSQEMFLSSRNLRTPDTRAARIASIYQNPRTALSWHSTRLVLYITNLHAGTIALDIA